MISTLHRGETRSQLPLRVHHKYSNGQFKYYSSSAAKEDLREETADTTAEESHNIIKNEEKVKGMMLEKGSDKHVENISVLF